MSPATLLLMSADEARGDDRWVEPAEQPAWEAPGHRGRVLVVDDDSTVRSLLSRILEEAGYEVETAADGPGALHTVSGGAEFDLVITDVRMPAMDGWELGRRLQRERPTLPVLYVSGYDQARSAPSALSFLRKPFEAPDLLTRIRRLLGEA